MNTSINPGREVVVNAPDEIGILSRISSTLADARIDIRAICAYAVDGCAHFRFLTDENERAINTLKEAGFDVKGHNVILCEVPPHSMHPEMMGFLNNYEVEHSYWCAATKSGEHAVLVFSPTDNIISW